MKKLHLALVLVATLILGSCSKKVYTAPAPKMMKNPYSISEVISHNVQGAVVLRGVGDETQDGKDAAVKLAHKKALQQLFYLGYVGTDFKNPMIREGQMIENTHKAFFDKFWDNGYERFITGTTSTFYSCKVENNCTTAVSEFTVNYNMLRKELENNKIIKKIGF